MIFFKKVSREKYSSLWTSLKNNYSRETKQWPHTLSDAYTMVCMHTPDHKEGPRLRSDRDRRTTNTDTHPHGISFLKQGEIIAGTDGNTFPNITCFKCRRPGHYANLCPSTNTQAFQGLQVQDNDDPGGEIHFMFTQTQLRDIPDTWVLLDSQSTVSVFRNKKLLKNIKNLQETMTLITNGGTMLSNMKGDVIYFGPVWYNEHSLANILSLSQLRKCCRVTMDTDKEAAIVVHRKDGSTMKFLEYTTGLYFYDTAQNNSNHSKSNVNNYCFVNTVANNKTMFTKRQIKNADLARKLYTVLK